MAIRDGRDHPATARALAPPGLGLPALRGRRAAGVEGRFQVVVQDGTGGRVRRREARRGLARPPRPDADVGRLRAEDVEVGREDLGRQLFERGDVVQHEQPATMRRHHQVVIPFDELRVVHRHGGEIGLERPPARPAVPRKPQARVGAEHEEAPEIGVLPYHVRGDVRRQALADVGPRPAVVGGFEDIGPAVVQLVAVDGEVRRARIERGDADLVDASFVLRESREMA